MWNFFFKKLGKSLLPFLFFHPGIKKKLKPPISPDFLMCNVRKVINLIKLPPKDPLPGSYNFLKLFFSLEQWCPYSAVVITGESQPYLLPLE